MASSIFVLRGLGIYCTHYQVMERMFQVEKVTRLLTAECNKRIPTARLRCSRRASAMEQNTSNLQLSARSSLRGDNVHQNGTKMRNLQKANIANQPLPLRILGHVSHSARRPTNDSTKSVRTAAFGLTSRGAISRQTPNDVLSDLIRVNPT